MRDDGKQVPIPDVLQFLQAMSTTAADVHKLYLQDAPLEGIPIHSDTEFFQWFIGEAMPFFLDLKRLNRPFNINDFTFRSFYQVVKLVRPDRPQEHEIKSAPKLLSMSDDTPRKKPGPQPGRTPSPMRSLGLLQYRCLQAIEELGDKAYNSGIASYVNRVTGQDFKIGHVHASLARLLDVNLVTRTIDTGMVTNDGKTRTVYIYRMTPAGRALYEASHAFYQQVERTASSSKTSSDGPAPVSRKTAPAPR